MDEFESSPENKKSVRENTCKQEELLKGSHVFHLRLGLLLKFMT